MVTLPLLSLAPPPAGSSCGAPIGESLDQPTETLQVADIVGGTLHPVVGFLVWLTITDLIDLAS